MAESREAFWIDVGGTFTDCLRRHADGTLSACKLLSDGTVRGRIAAGSAAMDALDPQRNEPADFFAGWTFDLLDNTGSVCTTTRVASSAAGTLRLADPLPNDAAGRGYVLRAPWPAPVTGIRALLGVSAHAPLSPLALRLGTTRGTNALLERKGARVGLLITRGFGDLPIIRDQRRPHLFKLDVPPHRPLHAATCEVEERVAADGGVLRKLDLDPVRATLAAWRAGGIASIAIACLNAYRNPIHERMLADAARTAGFAHVSVSCELSALGGFLRRTETAIVNAYLQPVVAAYLHEIGRHLPGAEIQLMTSAGGLVDLAHFAPRDSILSGPAGGVVGAAASGARVGATRVLGFDMGGTSTDVCRYDEAFARRDQIEIADPRGGLLELYAPQLEIETVAAGGGSICGFDGVKPTVGPDSAGADPGPACYGAGGPLCLTDVNLVLGRLVADDLTLPLDRSASLARLDEQIAAIAAATGRTYAREELAVGYLRIANEHMAAAIRRVSVQQGVDPRDFALVSFGGAGGQHACGVADLLGICRIICPPLAGMLSAYGIGQAPRQRFATEEIGAAWSGERVASYDEIVATLSARARDALGPTDEVRVTARLRYAGQEDTLAVPYEQAATPQRFAAEHARRYGFVLDGRAVELVALTVEAVRHAPGGEDLPRRGAGVAGTQSAWFGGHSREVPVVAGGFEELAGPVLLRDPFSAIVVEPGWTARAVDGTIELVRAAATGGSAASAGVDEPDAIALELFHNRFAGVAREMGATLERAALSTNIRQRHDFSCAVCDADGYLVAHAPHVPVHLGAIGACVRALLVAIGEGRVAPLRPGDVILSNDPYAGGSHLPDVTAITPVFDAERLIGFVANRAHHAEIGGITPGSMPPRARNLAEEGVVMRWMRGVDPATGHLCEATLRAALGGAPFPSRDIDQNLADLRAQVAANRRGVERLARLLAAHGVDAVSAYMRHIQQAAAEKLRAALAPLTPRSAAWRDALDDGTPVAVAIELTDGRVVVDFVGTGPVSATSLNASPAIVSSAVLYCLRCLVDDDVPLNEGLLRDVELRIPPGLLAPPSAADPQDCPGVAGGNVETSQRVVDCVLGALGVAAAGQGTMNNVTFGDDTFGYYETLGGGGGATPRGPGADARHCHMTNTRLTDPETLEDRLPVRLRTLALRRGSGGAGMHRGGAGLIRCFEFLRPLRIALLTQRRTRAPYGLGGGSPGEVGRNILERANGEVVSLEWFAEREIEAGDVLRIETPGGGGYGTPGGRPL